ncbi:hypothetical protein FZEAL_10946, partial [Fusarium zealandicum]
MLPRWSRLWVLLCLLLVFQHASGEVFRIAPRQDDEPRTTTAIESDSKSTREDESTSQTAEASSRKSQAPDESKSESESVSVTATGTEASATSESTSTDPSLPTETYYDPDIYNATIPAGQLPLTPKLTPGWGVAGVIMLLTGVTHALIGIKNRMVHTFFSTALSAALGVAVLIVYVMKVDVSDG